MNNDVSRLTNTGPVNAPPKYLYVGFGDAKSGGLAVIYTRSNKHITDIKTDARPGGIKIEKSRPQIYVTLSGATKLGVVDLKKRAQVTVWPTGVQANVALALDESHHRLFDGVRDPAKLIVLETESGKQVSQVEGLRASPESMTSGMTLRISVSMPRGVEGLKWGSCTSISKKMQIITN